MGKHSLKRDKRAEPDVQADPARADSRDPGGVSDPDAADESSSTGTTPTGEFVGRVAGEDAGYSEQTGAERRAER